MSDYLDNMQLPNRNEKEELEELSKMKLLPLFDLNLFQIREEEYRDKGVDLDFELKFKYKYTNFRFLVQMKATNTITKNSDNSYSKSIDTSNIQYLLNSGKPSYYFLYHNDTEEFYYSNVNEFLKNISQKIDWEKQETNTLRFLRRLDQKAIKEIYDHVMKYGQNIRRINEKIALTSKDNFGKISITDEKLNFYSETEMVENIEKYGLGLINEGNSTLVVNASNLISKNLQLNHPRFNLILAMAQYNTANMLQSLSSLKQARSNIEKLKKEDQGLLEYFTAATKYSLGILTHKEYSNTLDTIEESSFIEYYIQIEKIGKKYSAGLESYTIDDLRKDILKLIEKDDIPNTIANLASIEYYKNWSLELNCRHLQNSMMMSKKVYTAETIETGEQLLKQFDDFNSFFQITQTKIIEDKDYFNYWLLETNRINHFFEYAVIDTIITGTNKKILRGVESLIKEIRKVQSKYDAINHIENKIVCMAHEYEMLDFLNNKTETKPLEEEIITLLDLYELKDFKRRFNLIKAGDNKVNRLQRFFDEAENSYDNVVDKVKTYIDKISKLDKKDIERQETLSDDTLSIELFPMGIFSFQKDKLQEFYKILNITDKELIERLEEMFKFVTPRLNLFVKNIKKEGYLNGNLEYEGVQSWKLVHGRRRKLFEGGFIKRKVQI